VDTEELFHGVDKSIGHVNALGNAQPNIDKLDLLHRRTGHTSHQLLREAVRNGLVTGITLERKYFSDKARRKFKGVCDTCAKAKITRLSFPQQQDRVKNLLPGDRLSSDILIMLNEPSRDHFQYVLLVIDNASKYVWVRPLLRRSEDKVLAALSSIFDHEIASSSLTVKHFHSDGGSELVSRAMLTYLHGKGITTSHSPRDTPEMNSLTERKIKDVKQRTLSMLLQSGLPVSFWWEALSTAVYIQNRMPTKTCVGLCTPYEVLYGSPPNIGRLRQWGCKTYSLIPSASRRKNFASRAHSGFIVGYAEQKTGYKIFVPEQNKIIVSVHVLTDEVSPDINDDYLAELTRLQISDTAPLAQEAKTFAYLVGTRHKDDEDGLSYEITRIAESKDGYLCGYRRLVTPAGTATKEETVPIHVADLARLTEDLQLGESSASALTKEQRPHQKRARDSLNQKKVKNPVEDRSSAERGRQGKVSVSTCYLIHNQVSKADLVLRLIWKPL
jgi:hypothetical protein